MAAPSIINVTVGDNLKYDNDTLILTAEVDNMVGVDIQMVVFKILGQPEVFGFSTIDGINFTAEVPLERFTANPYGLCMIVAYNEDGDDVTENLFISLLDYESNSIVMEGFGSSPTEWENSGASSFRGSLEGMDVNFTSQSTSQYFYHEIDELDGTGRIHFSFMLHGKSTTDLGSVFYAGVYGNPRIHGPGLHPDNFMGFRFTATSLTYYTYELYIANKFQLPSSDTLIESIAAMRIPISGSAPVDEWRLIDFMWDPKDKTIQVKVYRYMTGVWTEEYNGCFTLGFDLDVELDMIGIKNHGSDLLPPYENADFWINNIYLAIGESLDTYPRIVSVLDVDTSYTPSDVQIMVHYYEFVSGDDVEADQNLVVEIFDKDDVLQDTVPGILRDDGWYEAYWDTTGVTRDTYLVKVTSMISGKTSVMEEWVSIQ